MRRFVFVIVVALLALPSVLMAQELVDEIDKEVVMLLSLSEQQAVAYSAIMQRRRIAFRNLKPRCQEQKMAFYEETFGMLKPVFTEEQYIRFVAYIDSFIEAAEDEDFPEIEPSSYLAESWSNGSVTNNIGLCGLRSLVESQRFPSSFDKASPQ